MVVTLKSIKKNDTFACHYEEKRLLTIMYNLKLVIMKKLILLVAFFICATAVYSQRIDVVETSGVFGKVSYPALATKVLFSDEKTVTKEFSSLLKSYNPEDLTNKKGVIFADNLIVPSISENSIDIYATVKEDKLTGAVDLVVAFSIGGNIYITSSQSPTQYQTAHNLLKIFANNLTEKNHASMLKNAEKVLSKEEKKLASLEKKHASYQKSIDSAREDISKIEKSISKNESKQNDLKADIEKQRNLVREKKDAYKKIEKQ